jgi:hypothetical protein
MTLIDVNIWFLVKSKKEKCTFVDFPTKNDVNIKMGDRLILSVAQHALRAYES